MENHLVAKTFNHMSWANDQVLKILSQQPDEVINLQLAGQGWTVGAITDHLVQSQAMLIARLLNEKPNRETIEINTAAQIAELIPKCNQNDQKLFELAQLPEQTHIFGKPGREVEFFSSTILAQAVHHATEHRAQIADILTASGNNSVVLDDYSVWAFERTTKQ